jgi:ketosteroid isomerase-like protein
MNVIGHLVAEALVASERAINERWNRGDVDGALEAYSEDVTYFDPLTERRLEGRKVVGVYFRQVFQGKLNIRRNELPNPQVIVSDGGDMAVVNYNLINIVPDGAGGEKTGTPWNSTQVYRLIDGKWRVVHANWSFTRHPAALQGLMT